APGALFSTRSLALLARLLDDRAVSAATGTRLRKRKQPLTLGDDATAVALRTDHGRRTRLGAGAAALAAGRRHLDRDLRLEPTERILERQADRNLDVGAPLRLWPPRTSGLAAVEDPTEPIAEIAQVVDREVAAAEIARIESGRRASVRRAERVVLLALLRIGERVV